MRNSLFLGQCWYFANNGTDGDSCGRIPTDPCKTLDEVMNIIYHDTYPSTNSTPLCIVTDFSMQINKTIMVRYLQCTSNI